MKKRTGDQTGTVDHFGKREKKSTINFLINQN
jgi:hypothetical protein